MNMINVAALAITKHKKPVSREEKIMWAMAAVFCLIVAALSFIAGRLA